jgi:peptide/nickel transport system ATP-binding protein
MQRPNHILDIHNLCVTFRTVPEKTNVLQNIDLSIREGERVCIMGESGCGKSVLGFASMRLLDDIADITGGVTYRGKELYSLDKTQLNKIRGKKICLISQNPATAFNPVIKIGKQIDESVQHAGIAEAKKAKAITLDCLSKVGFSEPLSIYDTYPHRLSGGMCERALIAMAISAKPDFIIADEPTKGLDVPAKKEVLSLLNQVSKDSSMMMITHDFKAAVTCERIAIMYSGEIIEEGPTAQVLKSPMHYYSQGLIEAQPSRGMKPIPGQHTSSSHNYAGCKFRDRCLHANDTCARHPELISVGDVKVRCHFAKA